MVIKIKSPDFHSERRVKTIAKLYFAKIFVKKKNCEN